MNRLACLAALRQTLRACGSLLTAIALTTPLAFGGVNRWTTSGRLNTQTVSSLAIDPVNPEIVYAGTGRAVFQSRDGGLSWTISIGTPLGSDSLASGLAIDPQFSSTVYAATDGGVFKSVDAGGNWAAVGPPVSNARAYTVAVDPVVPSIVYTGTADGLFKSNDRSASWSGRLLASSIYSLVFSPQTPSSILGADYEYSFYYPTSSRLYKSTDEGATWSQGSTSLRISPGALAVDPTNPSTLFAGAARNPSGGGGVYKSVDSGSTWRAILSFPFANVTDVVIDPRNTRTLYAASFTGAFRSTDGGESWTEFNKGLQGCAVTALEIDRTGTRLHAGTYDCGVFDYQILSGALDLSVGTDDRARLLFVDLDDRAVFRSIDNSGNSSAGGPYGPFNGWNARALADGLDGLTRVLWNHLDGSMALWLMVPTGNLASYRYGPMTGWTAVDVSASPDNTTHILRTNTDGRIDLWSLDLSGALVRAATFGPYTGWSARSISTGADGLTRLLWNKTDGTVGLSLIDAGHIVATYRFAGAPGFAARDVAVASDNKARILWANADGRIALWSVDNSGVVTNSGAIYEPPVSGQDATRISCGADGVTRVLWTSTEGTGTVWLMGLDNILQSSFHFGPN